MNSYEKVEIGNGKQAISMVPVQDEKQRLAIVDLDVLQRITSYLPKASVQAIKEELHIQIEECKSLAVLVTVLENEISFHKSVNLINEYHAEVNPQ